MSFKSFSQDNDAQPFSFKGPHYDTARCQLSALYTRQLYGYNLVAG
jgi:hypothetical protein